MLFIVRPEVCLTLLQSFSSQSAPSLVLVSCRSRPGLVPVSCLSRACLHPRRLLLARSSPTPGLPPSLRAVLYARHPVFEVLHVNQAQHFLFKPRV